MSAEVPKLHHRLVLGEPGPFGDRPPAEVIVVLSDPVVPGPLPSAARTGREPAFDERLIAFPALSRFDFV